MRALSFIRAVFDERRHDSRMTIRKAIRHSLFAISPSLGEKCAAMWDSLAPVFSGQLSLRGSMKYLVLGLCPGVGGRFTYFGTRVHFPLGSAMFLKVCEQDVYEADVTACLCRLVRPRTLFIDIGANIGLTSVPVLREVPSAQVLSFEPSPNSLQYLNRTRRESPFDGRWEIVGKAAADRAGVAQFSVVVPRYSAMDGLRDTGRAGKSSTVQVPVTTVDAEWQRLGSPSVSCIKIDVEGAEAQVLAGSEALITRERPSIVLEWNRTNLNAHRVDVGSLLQYAESHDYHVIALPDLVEVSELSSLEHHMISTEMFLLAANEQRVG